MEIKEQSGLRAVLQDVEIPQVYVVRQHFERDGIPDIPAYLHEKLNRGDLKSRIRPGMKVVLTGSSRQIANMPVILRELARFVKDQGGEPYIIPAMGSHGGATAEGQREILESYGITEDFCGCPIFSSMETVQVGTMACGDEVRMDRFAYEADAIIVVGRIKGHTAFRGPYESGLIKMMAIGLGKREGADSLHRAGFRVFGERLPEYAKIVFDHCNIIFGVGTIENEFDQTCRIEVLPAEEIFDKEPELLRYAKSRMPRLLFPETDILMVHEIGKNFSGSGMDPNITHTYLPGAPIPQALRDKRARRVAVLDLTEETHGAAMGIGMADVTTRRLLEKMDPESTYPNCLTSGVTASGKLPMAFDSHRLAIQAAVRTLSAVDGTGMRMVRIRDTLHLGEIWISAALLPQAREHPDVELLAPPAPMAFDDRGDLF